MDPVSTSALDSHNIHTLFENDKCNLISSTSNEAILSAIKHADGLCLMKDLIKDFYNIHDNQKLIYAVSGEMTVYNWSSEELGM